MATTTARRSRSPIPAHPFEVEPAEPAPPVRLVNGLAVIKDDPFPSPLSTPTKEVFYTGLRILTLADDTTVVGCSDCETTGTRGEIRQHRIAKHNGAPVGRRRPVIEVMPPTFATMTLGHLLEIANDFDRYADMFASLQEQHDQWKSRALDAEARYRKLTVALDRAGFHPAED